MTQNKPKGMEYLERNEVLKRMGFESYALYLKSELWSGIRDSVFSRIGRICSLCVGYATQVHHRQYTEENLAGESLEHMVPICPRCHEEIEHHDGNKLSSFETELKFRLKLGDRMGICECVACQIPYVLNRVQPGAMCKRCIKGNRKSEKETRRQRAKQARQKGRRRCATLGCGNFCCTERELCRRCKPFSKLDRQKIRRESRVEARKSSAPIKTATHSRNRFIAAKQAILNIAKRSSAVERDRKAANAEQRRLG